MIHFDGGAVYRRCGVRQPNGADALDMSADATDNEIEPKGSRKKSEIDGRCCFSTGTDIITRNPVDKNVDVPPPPPLDGVY